jgi:hypothetical protein
MGDAGDAGETERRARELIESGGVEAREREYAG